MVATAEALDAEMEERINRHRVERDVAWQTVEVPIKLPQAVLELAPTDLAVVDCLTLWVSNLLMRDMDIETGTQALIAALKQRRGSLWLVSNEVGLGIVPDSALARRFRDVCGQLHQQVAAVADSTFMLIAGLPLKLK